MFSVGQDLSQQNQLELRYQDKSWPTSFLNMRVGAAALRFEALADANLIPVYSTPIFLRNDHLTSTC